MAGSAACTLKEMLLSRTAVNTILFIIKMSSGCLASMLGKHLDAVALPESYKDWIADIPHEFNIQVLRAVQLDYARLTSLYHSGNIAMALRTYPD